MRWKKYNYEFSKMEKKILIYKFKTVTNPKQDKETIKRYIQKSWSN